MNTTWPKFVFFGTSAFSVYILEGLKEANILPSLIITTPDRPKGRNLTLTPSPAKEWAIQNKIEVWTPEKLKDEDFINKLKAKSYPLFLTASYGKIIPKTIIDMPEKGCVNVHPSLLPLYRGPSPIQTQILDNANFGTSIMLMDAEVDHGPIIDQKEVTIPKAEEELALSYPEIEKILGAESVKLLIEIAPKWLETQKSIPQDHIQATFTKMIEKADGKIDLKDDAKLNYRKYLAFSNWPGTYFFVSHQGKEIRVVIKKAFYKNGQFNIETVVPESKKEMRYEDFLKGLK
jgi:methionyl-tRNA formyltransferase